MEPLAHRELFMARVIRRVLVGTALFCELAPTGTAQRMAYHLEAPQPTSRFSGRQVALLAKLNHADTSHLPGLSRIVVPDRWENDELAYSPMPKEIDALAGEKKAVLVDLASQTFGAYESGALVRWGPVSSGDRRHQTPPGIYRLNWHVPVRVSSENPTWVMQWYFNFSSGLGLALHQYALPGRPASHGCVRLLQTDAKWLYRWGEGSLLDDDTGEPRRPGTLVVVMGRYDFKAPQPWLNPKWWAVGISASRLPTIESEAAAK